MSKRPLFLAMNLLVVMALALGACATPTAAPTAAPPEPTAAPPEPTAEPMPAIGSPEHPIKVLFVPSVDAQVIVAGGEIMKAALEEATGLTFEVSVPTSYAATIEEMCASPTDTMGFIPGLGYALASQLCGVDVSFKAIRFGFDVYWAQILVARDSDIDLIEDLEGLKWGFGDPGSTSGYMVPLVMFQDAGVTPGEQVQTGGHNQSAQAVYNGEVDFATTFYSPPTLLDTGSVAWEEGEDPDIPADLVASCAVNADDRLVCGNYRVRDARANIREASPDVIQKVRILMISPAIPNDTLSFGPEFPADVRAQIEAGAGGLRRDRGVGRLDRQPGLLQLDRHRSHHG